MQLGFTNKDRKLIGQTAEKQAKKYLLGQGLKFQTKNFYCRFGEIDLIMKDRETLVFIEVRSRRINAQVSASESISSAKIKKIQKTAEYYLSKLTELPNCRFDVIAITHNPQKSDYTIDWIKNAF